jgi:hypothetical protein
MYAVVAFYRTLRILAGQAHLGAGAPVPVRLDAQGQLTGVQVPFTALGFALPDAAKQWAQRPPATSRPVADHHLDIVAR